MKITLSKSQWEKIGNKTGWKTAHDLRDLDSLQWQNDTTDTTAIIERFSNEKAFKKLCKVLAKLDNQRREMAIQGIIAALK